MDHLPAKLAHFIWIPVWIWISLVASEPAGPSSSRSSSPPQQVDFYFPTPILEGEDLTMNCRFKTDQNHPIYQVKWYRGNREIFRYTQKESPPKKSFPFSSVIIDEKQSDMNKLVLRKVPLVFRGNVSCEVSWEPNFQTITKSGYLFVVSPPQSKPALTVQYFPPKESITRAGTLGIPVVKTDEVLTANCTSSANPAPNITFFINKENANSVRGADLSESVFDGGNKTEVKTASLRLLLSHRHFNVGGKLRVWCEAVLFNLYNASSEVYEAELYREPKQQASGYGVMYGRSSAAVGMMGCGTPPGLGRLVWPIWRIGVVQLVLFLATSLTTSISAMPTL